MKTRGPYDVLVVGGGAAGVGVAVALKHAGIENFLVLERFQIGASFCLWPAETRFITPSFPANSIGMLDLNSVALGTSPAHMLRVEHPTGEDFAVHLNAVAQAYKLPVREGAGVKSVTPATQGEKGFLVELAEETLRAKHVVWAAGEFQYPRRRAFQGSDVCRPTAMIASYEALQGSEFVIIGGYESGIDAAYHLALRGKPVRLFDRGCPWENASSDPSVALSVYSLERMKDPKFREHVELHPHSPIVAVRRSQTGYEVETETGRRHQTRPPPLLAAGFEGSHRLVSDLFEQREDGYPRLSDRDESTITPGLFLCGPALRHENHIFCFIYKFRQRFAVVAKAVATSLGLPAEGLNTYRQWGMYLDDLSCCGEECVC